MTPAQLILEALRKGPATLPGIYRRLSLTGLAVIGGNDNPVVQALSGLRMMGKVQQRFVMHDAFAMIEYFLPHAPSENKGGHPIGAPGPVACVPQMPKSHVVDRVHLPLDLEPSTVWSPGLRRRKASVHLVLDDTVLRALLAGEGATMTIYARVVELYRLNDQRAPNAPEVLASLENMQREKKVGRLGPAGERAWFIIRSTDVKDYKRERSQDTRAVRKVEIEEEESSEDGHSMCGGVVPEVEIPDA